MAAGCFVSARLADDGYPDLRIALDVAGLAVVTYLTALTVDGWMLVAVWAAEAVALARLSRHDTEGVAAWGAAAHLMLAAGYALAEVAPLEAGPAEPLAAAAALLSVGAATAAISRLADQPELRAVLEGLACAAVAYLAVYLLDGELLVLALAAGSALLVELARREARRASPAPRSARWGWPRCTRSPSKPSRSPSWRAWRSPARPRWRWGPSRSPPCGARGYRWRVRTIAQILASVAAVTLLYLASVLVVTPFQPGNPGAEAALFDLGVRQQGQVALSVLWGTVGFGALLVGLRRDLRLVRLGALSLLLVTVAKVFMFDLATLTSIYRVMSFIGLGLFLLTAAFVWQRLRPRAVPDMREVPDGIR